MHATVLHILPLIVITLSSFGMSRISAAAEVRVRKSYQSLTEDERKLFVQAVLDLKNRDAPTKGEKGKPQNMYDFFERQHDTSDTNAHGRSVFLPWHRKLLLDFENALRGLDAKYKDLTIPYWDWNTDSYPSDAKQGSGDNLFMGPNGAMADGWIVKDGPFKSGVWKTYEGVGTDGENVYGDLKRQFDGLNDLKDATVVPNLLKIGDFKDFRAALEAGDKLHNQAHGSAGGNVGQIGDPSEGANDPTFWLLHSYVDLLWARWECENGLQYVPTDKVKEVGIDGTMVSTPPFAAATTPRSQLNFFTLGYAYQYTDASAKSVTMTPANCPKATPEPDSIVIFVSAVILAAYRRPRRCTAVP